MASFQHIGKESFTEAERTQRLVSLKACCTKAGNPENAMQLAGGKTG